MVLSFQILFLVILIFLSALSSGVETALISLSRAKVKAVLKQGKKGADSLYRIKSEPSKLIITILICNNLVNIAAASLATVIFTNAFGSSGVGIATGVMTFIILVFGEITPKTFATYNAERISLMFARPVEVLSFILSPSVKTFEYISKIMSRLLGSKKEDELSEEELKTIVTMGAEEGILNKKSAEMMHNILEFRGTKVVEIMTPTPNMKTLDGEKKLKEVIDFVVKTPFSRYPVYLNSKDKIIGILDVDDVLRYVKDNKVNVKIKNLLRGAFFVPESKDVDDLLSEFQDKKTPMAIVVDEYGDIAGLVTAEDVLEEIVGELFDKDKKQNVLIKKVKDNLVRIDAKTPLGDVNKFLKLDLKGEQFNTIAGYIQEKLQRIPKKGEKIELKNVTIEVDKVTKQEIKSVKIIKHK